MLKVASFQHIALYDKLGVFPYEMLRSIVWFFQSCDVVMACLRVVALHAEAGWLRDGRRITHVVLGRGLAW